MQKSLVIASQGLLKQSTHLLPIRVDEFEQSFLRNRHSYATHK